MILSIVSLFPDLYNPFLNTSIIAKAQEKKLVKFELHNLFDYCNAKERIDSPTFGHGAGMLIRPAVVEKSIEAIEEKNGSAFKVFFSPQGQKLNQELLKHITEAASQKGHMMLLPARYEGMDARVEQHYADIVISIGDYVLMGGDLPAMVLIEGMLRLVPGVIGKFSSVEHESFSGAFVDYPEYTAPVEWKGIEVPEVLRSGNHKAMEQWRKNEAAKNTVLHHFDWLRSHVDSVNDKKLAAGFIPSHYAVLMHTQVLLEEGREGNSSVTSIDIHDIARSSRTFGIKKYFIVTPLADQQKVINKLLEFWNTEVGINYNPNRHSAISNVILVSNLEEALAEIEKIETSRPILIATAARNKGHANIITFNDQERIWSLNRPITFIFGTARGLADSVLSKAEYLLVPIEGFSDFNHLSVRSAAAIVFDRWLGINKKNQFYLPKQPISKES